MNRIVNLTQHAASPEQRAAGVFDLEREKRERLQRSLTFVAPPDASDILTRAEDVAALAGDAPSAMIGGATYLMGALEHALRRRGVRVLHSFTQRVVSEEQQPDGSVQRVIVFRHEGFVEPPDGTAASDAPKR